MTETKNLTPEWKFIADTVMGGVSTGSLSHATRDGRHAHRLTGQVSLDHDGGFIQMAFDPASDGASYDASRWTGIELDVLGNTEVYEVRLRTSELMKPWQSYRAEFLTSEDWKTIRLHFDDFTPHRHDKPLDPSQLCRIGVVAIGREFQVDIAVSDIRFFR